MAALQAADLVTTTRIGQWRHYKRNEQQIEKLAAFIRQGL
jgi:DNA-binding transcriptional ArsR family regulator